MPSVLSIQNLLLAYSNGYFPMPDPETGEIVWLKPDPRAVLPLEKFHRSHSLKKSLAKPYEVKVNTAFREVMLACSERKETWITDEFLQAYSELRKKGYADSIEVWKGGKLVGGVYGVSLGRAFFAESMFHKERDTSKIALSHLVDRLKSQGFKLLEVQFLTPHLKSLGAIEIPAADYEKQLRTAL